MKIIQVIDLDGTTVKVDETNPSEPKIVSALQFDVATRKAVPIAKVAELIFAKPLNANVEAVCVGYKGTDGKYYGIDYSMFAPKPQPAPEPEVNGFIELIIPSDYAGNPEMRILVDKADTDGSQNPNVLYYGADLTKGIYATIGTGTDVYHFSHVSTDEEGIHTLRADKVYRTPLSNEVYVQFGVTADTMERAGTLNSVSTSDGLSYTGGTFRLTSPTHINDVLNGVDHL